MSRRFIGALLWLLLVSPACAQTKQKSIRIDDDSDWWSIIRDGGYSWPGVDEQTIATAKSNFKILGISLEADDPARDVSVKLGKNAGVVRGDGATWRNQHCYVSTSGSHRTYFVIESGEVQSTFYLFLKAADWNGSQYCKPTKLIDNALSTASGLRLGITPAQIEAVLGKPTAARAGGIAYIRAVRIKSSPAQLRKHRAKNLNMTEAEFESNFAYYDESTYIEARFKDSKLIYLAISESQTY